MFEDCFAPHSVRSLLSTRECIEVLLVCDIENESTAVGSMAECIFKVLELILACSVPDLEI